MANYEIEDGWDYAYVQVSTDGKEFHNLQGNITTNDNPEGANRGNGITGNSNGWVNATFSLFAYAGNDVFFRIAYDTDDYTNEEGFYFDNFTPIMAFESFEQIATAIPDTFIALEYVELEEMCSKWYSVRAIDEQDDVSKWSAPIETVINPETSEVNGNDKIPAEFTVGELYPNPFNPSTSLELNLPQSANLKVRLYDILGREALTVTQGLKAAGKHSLSINASGLATGLYFVVVDANGQDGTNYHSVRKAIFMK